MTAAVLVEYSIMISMYLSRCQRSLQVLEGWLVFRAMGVVSFVSGFAYRTFCITT